MNTLLDLLMVMNKRAKPVHVIKKAIASPQEHMAIQFLNDHIDREFETTEIAKHLGIRKDVMLKILVRIERMNEDALSSRVCVSSGAGKVSGKHGKTKARKWICHSRMIARA